MAKRSTKQIVAQDCPKCGSPRTAVELIDKNHPEFDDLTRIPEDDGSGFPPMPEIYEGQYRVICLSCLIWWRGVEEDEDMENGYFSPEDIRLFKKNFQKLWKDASIFVNRVDPFAYRCPIDLSHDPVSLKRLRAASKKRGK